MPRHRTFKNDGDNNQFHVIKLFDWCIKVLNLLHNQRNNDDDDDNDGDDDDSRTQPSAKEVETNKKKNHTETHWNWLKKKKGNQMRWIVAQASFATMSLQSKQEKESKLLRNQTFKQWHSVALIG